MLVLQSVVETLELPVNFCRTVKFAYLEILVAISGNAGLGGESSRLEGQSG